MPEEARGLIYKDPVDDWTDESIDKMIDLADRDYHQDMSDQDFKEAVKEMRRYFRGLN